MSFICTTFKTWCKIWYVTQWIIIWCMFWLLVFCICLNVVINMVKILVIFNGCIFWFNNLLQNWCTNLELGEKISNAWCIMCWDILHLISWLIFVAAWNRWLFEKLVSINENFYSSDLSLNRYGFGNVGFIDLCYVMVFNFVHYLVEQDSR